MSTKKTPKRRPDTKKEIVLGRSTRKVNPFIAMITLVILAAAVSAAYFVWTAPGQDRAPAGTPQAAAPNDGPAEVVYPVSLFDDGKARHFEYASNGKTIRYFILKSSDGVIRAAFDACDVCWPSGKGYTQSGDEMVCDNCGRRFASVRINEVKGGCNPAPLNRSVDGERLIIRTEDIVQGQNYFNL